MRNRPATLRAVTGFHYKNLNVVYLGLVVNIRIVTKPSNVWDSEATYDNGVYSKSRHLVHTDQKFWAEGPIYRPLTNRKVGLGFSNLALLLLSTKEGYVFHTVVNVTRLKEIQSKAGTYSTLTPTTYS